MSQRQQAAELAVLGPTGLVAWLAEVPTGGRRAEAVPQRLELCSQFCQQVCKKLLERREVGKNEEQTNKTPPGAGGALSCVPPPPCRAALHCDVSGPDAHGRRPLRPLSPRTWQGAGRSRRLAGGRAEARAGGGRWAGGGRLPPQQQVHARTPPPAPGLPRAAPAPRTSPGDEAPCSLQCPAGLPTASSRPDSLKSAFEEGVCETGRKVAARLVGHRPCRERAADG